PAVRLQPRRAGRSGDQPAMVGHARGPGRGPGTVRRAGVVGARRRDRPVPARPGRGHRGLGTVGPPPRARPPLAGAALVLSALPPLWDFATSGLETGLTFGWLGGCQWLLARRYADS